MTARLCEECKHLKFDDTVVSRLEYHSEDGTSYLISVDEDSALALETDYEFADFFPSLPKLEKSARDGCDCCRWLRETIQRAPITPPGPMTRVVIRAKYIWRELPQGWPNNLDHGLRALYLLVDFFPVRSVHRPLLSTSTIVLDIYSSSEPCATWLRLEPAPSSEVLDATNVKWLHDRVQKHRHSMLYAQQYMFLPTRLIDLEPGQQNQPRLVLSTDLSPPGYYAVKMEYAALSYCWGPPADAAHQLKTERGTVDERLASIDTHSMTPVVRDAVKVCNALGIRYLWVDALCILQDDRSDWDRESQQMDRIFSNAVVTICPMSSSSCQQGFLTRSSHSFDIQFNSAVKPSVSGHYTMEYSFLDPVALIDNNTPFSRDLEDSAWDKRAWTFQELNSSELLIMFGRRKVHVLNHQGITSEGRIESVECPIGIPLISEMHNTIFHGRYAKRKHIYWSWMQHVCEYNMRQLTYPTDKFPALSGIASYLSRMLPHDSYAAGLWRADLFRQLFWTEEHDQCYNTLDELINHFRSPQFCIAPSWSWARHNNYFEFGFHFFQMTDMDNSHYRPECTRIQPSITPSDENPLGQINSAHLTIISRVLPLSYVPRRFYHEVRGISWKIKDSKGKYMAYCALDWVEKDVVVNRPLYLLLLGSRPKEECRYIDENEEKDTYVNQDKDDEDDNEDENMDEIMDKGRGEEEKEYEETEEDDDGGLFREERLAWGLIICGAEDDDPQDPTEKEYYRVGIFYSYPKGKGGLKLFDKCETKTICLI